MTDKGNKTMKNKEKFIKAITAIGTKYKEFYTRILHWCWFADYYFLGEWYD